MRMALPFILVVLALAATVVLDRPQPKADFTFVNRAEIFTLDPQRMTWMQDLRMAYALFEPLVRWRADDLSIEPAACAELPEVSADQLVYTFRIRPEARWSNGAPVTAHDYIWTWQRAMLPDTASDYSMLFFCIDGVEAFFHWRRQRLSDFAEPGGRPGARYATTQPSGSTPAPSPASALWQETQERFGEVVGLRALDDHTLEVRLARHTPYFLDLVAFGTFHPVYRPCVEGWEVDAATEARIIRDGWHAVEPPPFERRRFLRLNQRTARVEQSHDWTRPTLLISNGPYILTDWRYKRGMRLERNPQYHSPEEVKSDSIAIVPIEDVNTAVLAFERGQVDWLTDVGTDYQSDMLAQRERYMERYAEEIEGLIGSGLSLEEALGRLPEPGPGERRNVHVLPAFGTDFYSFNCRPTLPNGQPNPFHDARVRRAFVASVNREVIVRQVTRLNEPVVTTFIPRDSIVGYDSPEGVGYDPDWARSQLHEAGWWDRQGDGVLRNARGDPFPVVDVLYSTNTPRYGNISLALRDMWQRELGVRVELRGKESKAFREDLKSGNFMLGRGRWYGDYSDPTTFLDVFRTEDGNNDRGYSHPYVDDLLRRAADETDPQRRMALLAECERFLFAEEVPMLVLCQLVQLYMYEPGRVRGLSGHPRLIQQLWRVETTDEE